MTGRWRTRSALAGAVAALGFGLLFGGSAAAHGDRDDGGRTWRDDRDYDDRGRGHGGYGRHGALHHRLDRKHHAWHSWNGPYADRWDHHRFHRQLDRRHRRGHHRDFDDRYDRHRERHRRW